MSASYKTVRKYNTNIHIVSFNPKNVEFVLVTTDDNSLQTVEKLENHYLISQGYKAKAKINGGFFQSNGQANGWEFKDFSNLQSEGWKDGVVDLFYRDGKLISDDVNMNEFNSNYNHWAQWGLSASYNLVKNGKQDLTGSSKFSHSTSYQPRTFVGQREDGTILLFVCDGRNKNNSTGLTATQQSQVCLDEKCIVGVNLDGGGSSTMIYNGVLKNVPTDGSMRRVANAIVVYEKETVVEKPSDSENKDIEKVNKTIALDFGHGGHDSGASGNGLREKDVTLEVGLKVKKRLVDNGFNVITLREDDTFVGDAGQRGANLGKTKADYALSIHVNAGGGNGAELIVPCKESYGNIEYFMQEEFKKIGNWRKICSRHYTTGTFYNRTINATTKRFDQTVNATDYYGIPREAWKYGVSADIIELFFIDTKSNIDNYLSKKDEYVEAIVKSICLGFSVEYKEEQPDQLPPVEEKPKEEVNVNENGETLYYRVCAGSYTLKSKAQEQQEKLKQQGIDSFLVATWIN